MSVTITLATIIWLFTIAVTLHMIEEIIWLPAWSQKAEEWHEPVTRREFTIATAIMLLFVYIISFLASQVEPASIAVYLVCSLALLMIVNLFIPHLGAAVAQRRYAPGLATSLFLVLPTAVLLIQQAFTEALIALPWFFLVGLSFMAAAAVIWPLLFRIGRSS